MTEPMLPLLVEPEQLEPLLGDPRLLVVDLSRASTYSDLHLPGAVHLEYGRIVGMRPPAGGLLPEQNQLEEALSAIGLRPDQHVVAYDDEGGGKAARLLWTLELMGHTHYSLLNGCLHAWANERHRLAREVPEVQPSDYRAHIDSASPALAATDYILAHLDDANTALLDARTPEEFSGAKRFSARGGHIPGAVNVEWTQFMDTHRNLRLKPDGELLAMLEERGIVPGMTVVAYCQTHHRSAHTWFVLKYLGFAARGYPGSWSEWGNRDDTPVEAA